MAYSYGFSEREIGLEVGRIGERVRQRVKTTVGTRSAANPTSDVFRQASVSAVSATRRFRLGASSAAVDAVAGAIKATKEITGESTEFVRDAVIGVMEGTEEVAKVGRPVVRDVVAAAIRSSSAVGDSVPDAAREAVEGAIVGAHAIGVNGAGESVGAQASAGVVKALEDVDAEFESIVSPAIHGVIVGVIATGGDLFDAMRDTAESLMRSGEKTGRDIPGVARLIVDEAIHASNIYSVSSTDAMMGAAQGCVEAAYGMDVDTGDATRLAVMAVVDGPMMKDLAPSIRESVTDALGEISEDLRERPHAWRGVALWRAGVSLVRVNGIDIGAALAYYMLLALFPLVALIILGLSVIIDPTFVRDAITELVRYYFPGSQDFLGDAFDRLFEQRVWVGIIALGGMILGSQGLFMATNRGVNLVFGLQPKRAIGVTAITVGILGMALLLFLLSVWITGLFQFFIGATEGLRSIGVTVNFAFVWAGGAFSVILPFMFAGIVFIVVYKYIPNRSISWMDATFGGVVTVIIFEAAKYIFLLLGNLAAQRSLLYGSLSSAILLLVWSQAAGMIFLYGAALTKQSADLRPSRSALTLRQEREEEAREHQRRREEDIALGRDDRAYKWKDPSRRPHARREHP